MFKKGDRIYSANGDYTESLAKHGGSDFHTLAKDPSIPIFFNRLLDAYKGSIEITFTTDRQHTYWALASDFKPKKKPTILIMGE